ncbi:MAG: rhomboid family intramembrane serine protease [Verrucomicrobia bacterium]|nr:rhomboid family intramembrane serine protease [Verrucomicrobiota bacterium]
MNPDTPTPVSPASDLTFPVRYNLPADATANPEFKGSGELTISSDLSTYRFTGTKPGLFSGQPKTLTFTSADIRNVTQNGALLSFVTDVGQCGRLGRRFEFLCADADAATTVRAMLPTRIDAEFTAEQDFAARLQQLPAASSWATSVTGLIILANIAVFIVMGAFFHAGWFEVDSMMAYIRYGANNGAATTGGEWWRLLTSAFLHFGLVHLLLNMWALFSVGGLLERLLGRALYLLLYLASAIGGGLLSIAWNGDKLWSAGASGAVFGVYGGLLGYVLRHKEALPRSVWKPLQNSALTFAGYNLIYGAIHPGIDNAAHIGGLVTGLALGWLIAIPVEPALRPALIRKNFRLGLGACLIVFVAAGAALPRFNYRLSEELAWEDATKDLFEPETALLKQDQESRSALSTPAAQEKYVAWVGSDVLPYYEKAAQKLVALHFSPGLRTERRRLALLEYVRVQADAYRHLSLAIQNDSEADVTAYKASVARANQILAGLKTP